MKKIFALIAMALMLLTAVSATVTTLDPGSMTMAYSDSKVVTFCINDNSGNPVDVGVVVDPVCKDLDGVIGCSGADEFDPAGFSVVPNDATTGADGCVNLTITTTLAQNEGGLFYYTVNGVVDNVEVPVGSETGQVFVPEMTVVGAMLVLGLAGLFIYKKRE